MKSLRQALPVCCSLVNSKGIESPFLCKAPRPSARVLTLRHAPTSRQISSFGILQTRIGKRYTYMLAYVTQIIFPLRAVPVLHRKISKSDQTGFARYKGLLKFLGSSQATYGYRASYSQSDQIFKQRSRTGLVGFNKRFKCVENAHPSTTDYCSVKRAPVAKHIQYYL